VIRALHNLISAIVLIAFFTFVLTLANAGAGAMFPGSL
jgi:hypothetical protein